MSFVPAEEDIGYVSGTVVVTHDEQVGRRARTQRGVEPLQLRRLHGIDERL